MIFTITAELIFIFVLLFCMIVLSYDVFRIKKSDSVQKNVDFQYFIISVCFIFTIALSFLHKDRIDYIEFEKKIKSESIIYVFKEQVSGTTRYYKRSKSGKIEISSSEFYDNQNLEKK